MLDGRLKPLIDPFLDRFGRRCAAMGISANHVTVAGLALGLIGAAMIIQQWYLAAALIIILSRICDGLDGAVARASTPTDFGGYLDIVLDFVFYGAIPLAFIIADPSRNAVAGAVLIFSFYVNGASFLAFAIMAEKRKLVTEQRGKKSFFFTTGLAEAFETYAVFVAFCLFPGQFPVIAWAFAIVCFYTATARIVTTARLLQ